MARLSDTAKAQLREAGITQADWARTSAGQMPPDLSAGWTGDACGCPDDRCIGFHHYESEECGCIRTLIQFYDGPRKAARDA
jgi:hypothetical protein